MEAYLTENSENPENPVTRSTLMTIAVIGGTGKEGAGLAMRWARGGYRVLIGSRDGAKAAHRADELNTLMGFGYLQGMANLEAAQAADVVVLTVPYDGRLAILEGLRGALKGKLIIDVTVPMRPPDIRTVHVPEGKSACLEAQAFLGPETTVVAAFQNVGAAHLQTADQPVACDVLVCGDNVQAKDETIKLVQAAGMRGIDAGPLANAVAVESLTPVLLYINKRYKVKGAGIAITGLE
jgi:NADPH-dependent F420 reductase